MENLFYGRRISRVTVSAIGYIAGICLYYSLSISQIFDLKGSERNRYVQSKGQNDVLMDENLLECE